MSTVHVVVPDTVDDPARPSGGNTYDRRICAELAALGWSVRVHEVPGSWPAPHPESLAFLTRELASLPDDAVVLLDGLVASCAPDVVVPESARVRVVVLVHLPLGHRVPGEPVLRGDPAVGERLVLDAAAAVLATSAWTRDWLVDRYGLAPDRVHVARPGADPAAAAPGSPSGDRLLCVAAVVPAKGHLLLIDALASVPELPWRLVCAGAVDLAPDHVARVRARCHEAGIADRVTFVGPVTSRDLDLAYAAADVLVHASRIETYGLVVTEALARGLPVIATSVGGVEEALGTTPGGHLPGVLVPPRPGELDRAVRTWLEDPGLRDRLRALARERRGTLAPWSTTAAHVAAVLAGVAA